MELKKEKSMMQALHRLNESIVSYQSAENLTEFPADYQKVFEDRDTLLRSLRDSMIQRFEFCVDLFWKYLKWYLIDVEKVTLNINSPKATIRALCNVRLITERQAEQAMYMVDHRNLTSHIYKEEVAQMVSDSIPDHYKLLKNIVAIVLERSLSV